MVALEKRSDSRRKKAGLTALELESIEMFIIFLRVLGWQKSSGEIYGLLFVSGRPLAMDEIMDRLGISLGAASQGLKVLRDFGAVRATYVAGARKDHYVASGELSRFAISYVEEELLPRMENAAERILRMEKMMDSVPEETRQSASDRLARLKYWLDKAHQVIPSLIAFMKT